MQYLNIIYFLIITFYGYRFLRSDGTIIKAESLRDKSFHYTGLELFWCLTFSTGLLAFSANVGFDLMAIRLGVLELFCFIGLKLAKDKPVMSVPIIIYSVYLLWLVVGCFYSPSFTYGIRVILKYLYPFLLCLFASAVVKDNEVFLKSSLWARKVAVISLIFSFVPFFKDIFPGVLWYGTARAINYISIMIFSLGLVYYTKEKRKNLFYTLLFLVPCFIWVFRTSIMGSVLAIMIFFFFKYKIKALPIMVGSILIAVSLAFAIPSVRDKMFYDSKGKNADMVYEGEITADDIDSNGRFAMWEWSIDKFWEPNKLCGTGTGNLQQVFYSLDHPFKHIRIPHNDYVQILCDNGVIGIVLFGGSFLFIICHCFIIYNRKRYPNYLKLCALTGGASLAGMMLTMYTDNVINYSMATLSMPLGFYGMALGIARKIDSRL